MIAPFEHIIPQDAVQMIRDTAAVADDRSQLHPAQLELAYRMNWFNLFVPKSYGGLELSLPEALQLEEALAWTDGSLGWTITLCSGANFFIGFLQPEIAGLLFANPQVCFAGSGAATGTATINEEGYHIAGNWKYATGAPHATVFTAVCQIRKNGQLLKDSSGNPLTEAFWFYANEVKLLNDWHMMGMKATASRGFEITALQVPPNRRFTIHPNHSFLPQPIFKYPFQQFAEATLAVNFSGMAMRFLELLLQQPGKVEKAGSLPQIQEASLLQARDVFYEQVNLSWEALIDKGAISEKALMEISTRSKTLYQTSLLLMQTLYPAFGIQGADSSTEVNRVWRNFFTASQHMLLR